MSKERHGRKTNMEKKIIQKEEKKGDNDVVTIMTAEKRKRQIKK